MESPLLAIGNNASLRYFRIGFTYQILKLCPLLVYKQVPMEQLKDLF